MRSRSYSAIVHSSFLLLLISCVSQEHQADNKKSPAPTTSLDALEDIRGEDRASPEDSGDFLQDVSVIGNSGDEEASEIVEVISGVETLTSFASLSSVTSRVEDGCAPGEMPFEGSCVAKDRVKKIVDRRGAEALQKVQQATKPEQMADATHDLLEQQIAKMDKAEDDLDEIIEQLKEEKRKEGAKKEEDL